MACCLAHDLGSINFALYSEEKVELKDAKLMKEVTCIVKLRSTLYVYIDSNVTNIRMLLGL